ncbi:hypothetical protein Leryth_001193 [Lithospermum erythrorhizon]|nr:hypothetical protein Leryth_001193 [Lithospermum erythrorhizon]
MQANKSSFKLSLSAKMGSKSLNVTIILVLIVIAIWNAGEAEALTAAECRVERRALVNACKAIIVGRTPSSLCCKRIRASHITQCVCPVITRKLAALVDVNYISKVVRGCGRSLPRRFKCGSITIS